jgi:hypothetical protein
LEFTRAGDTRPEFWGYYADYDWVVFCWLYGTMMELPKDYPMFCRDLKQYMDERDWAREDLPSQEDLTQHSAIGDARWIRKAARFMNDDPEEQW